MLSRGDDAPEFTLPGVDSPTAEFERYRLDSATETGAVVLVFYPFDFSPVCTSELCQFRDAEWLTMTPEIDVWGISRDACYAHRRFMAQNNLGFPLLSDVQGDAIRDYGVAYDEWELHPRVPRRTIFVVDSDRTIQYAWEADTAYENPVLDDLHDAIRSLDVDLAD